MTIDAKRSKLAYGVDRWTDPGDYPSNAGGGPLPDGPEYVEWIDASIVCVIEPKELATMFAEEPDNDWYGEVQEYVNERLDGHRVTGLSLSVERTAVAANGSVEVIVSVDDFEGDN